MPLFLDVLISSVSVLFTLALFLWITADFQRPTNYRVVPHVESNDLGEVRTRYKIQQLKWFGWQNYTSWYSGCDVEYIPVFENPEEAEAKILELRQSFHK